MRMIFTVWSLDGSVEPSQEEMVLVHKYYC